MVLHALQNQFTTLVRRKRRPYASTLAASPISVARRNLTRPYCRCLSATVPGIDLAFSQHYFYFFLFAHRVQHIIQIQTHCDTDAADQSANIRCTSSSKRGRRRRLPKSDGPAGRPVVRLIHLPGAEQVAYRLFTFDTLIRVNVKYVDVVVVVLLLLDAVLSVAQS